MGNITVTPFPTSDSSDSSPVKIEWKKEGKFGPFAVENKADAVFGGMSDLDDLGVSMSLQNEWQKSDAIIITFEGTFTTNSVNRGSVKWGSSTGPSFISNINTNTSVNLTFTLLFLPGNFSKTDGSVKYFAPILNPEGDALFPPTSLHYQYLTVTNGYYTVYTGKYILA